MPPSAPVVVMVLLSTIISACDGLSAAGTASGRRLKVLCLHGYGQTAAIFRDRSGGFRKPMKKSQFELFYVDGPFGCTKDGENEADADADLSRRAWWRGHSAQTTYPGWPEARDMLKDLWEREEMDGILGFSQGAGAAAMLSAELKPSFAIFVSGFVPRDEAAAASLLAGVRGVRSSTSSVPATPSSSPHARARSQSSSMERRSSSMRAAITRHRTRQCARAWSTSFPKSIWHQPCAASSDGGPAAPRPPAPRPHAIRTAYG